MSVAMSPVISESCEYKENVAESPLAAGNPPTWNLELVTSSIYVVSKLYFTFQKNIFKYVTKYII